MLKCNLRKICFDQDIKSISELQRITGISRPTLYKMFLNKDVDTIKLDTINIICIKLNLSSITELIEYSKE